MADVFGLELPREVSLLATGDGAGRCENNADCSTRGWMSSLFASEVDEPRGELTTRDEFLQISQQLKIMAASLQALNTQLERPLDTA